MWSRLKGRTCDSVRVVRWYCCSVRSENSSHENGNSTIIEPPAHSPLGSSTMQKLKYCTKKLEFWIYFDALNYYYYYFSFFWKREESAAAARKDALGKPPSQRNSLPVIKPHLTVRQARPRKWDGESNPRPCGPGLPPPPTRPPLGAITFYITNEEYAKKIRV